MKSTVFKKAKKKKKKKDVKAQPKCRLRMYAIQQDGVGCENLSSHSSVPCRSQLTTKGPHPQIFEKDLPAPFTSSNLMDQLFLPISNKDACPDIRYRLAQALTSDKARACPGFVL